MAYSLISVVLCTVVTACAASNYMGIPLTQGAAPADMQDLAQRARAGDKQAQLDLGIRFEEGSELPAARQRAIRLYRMAASDRGGGQIQSFSMNGKIVTTPVYLGKHQSGLADAKVRLQEITNQPRRSNLAFDITWYEMHPTEDGNGRRYICNERLLFSRHSCRKKTKYVFPRVNLNEIQILALGNIGTDIEGSPVCSTPCNNANTRIYFSYANLKGDSSFTVGVFHISKKYTSLILEIPEVHGKSRWIYFVPTDADLALKALKQLIDKRG